MNERRLHADREDTEGLQRMTDRAGLHLAACADLPAAIVHSERNIIAAGCVAMRPVRMLSCAA